MPNSFSDAERDALLQLKGVGPTVVKRLEQIGIVSFRALGQQDAGVLTKQISDMMGSTCWHNSPLARNAIKSAIELARK
jgi:nucleotidyltransferase/DNA polymerase involved in DNA repair